MKPRTPRPRIPVEPDAQLSCQRGGASTGNWVVVGTLRSPGIGERGGPQLHACAWLDGRAVGRMRRFPTLQVAVACAGQHSAIRVGGGWAFNLHTGDAVRIPALTDPDKHHLVP